MTGDLQASIARLQRTLGLQMPVKAAKYCALLCHAYEAWLESQLFTLQRHSAELVVTFTAEEGNAAFAYLARLEDRRQREIRRDARYRSEDEALMTDLGWR